MGGGWGCHRAVELSKFDIEYHSRSAIKGQIIADFIFEILDVQPHDLCETLWMIETDDSSKAAGGGVDMVLQSLEDLSITQAVKFSFVASNNEVE